MTTLTYAAAVTIQKIWRGHIFAKALPYALFQQAQKRQIVTNRSVTFAPGHVIHLFKKLKYTDIVGDWREGTNYCMLGEARNMKQVSFMKHILITRAFSTWKTVPEKVSAPKIYGPQWGDPPQDWELEGNRWDFEDYPSDEEQPPFEPDESQGHDWGDYDDYMNERQYYFH
jgi:hypothetical protein